MKKDKRKNSSSITEFFYRRSTIAILLGLICLIGLPLRMQNIELDGYISDDAWWHYRHVDYVVEHGDRLNPDIQEFTNLSRPLTYPPLYHYLVGSVYKLFSRFMTLIKFTHYFNIVEAMIYILLIYGLACVISQDRLFSLIAAMAASLSYGMIIRARAGELMPFVLADLFSLGAILLIFIALKNIKQKSSSYLCIISGIMFGLALLAWSGAAMIYLPFILFIWLAIIISNPGLIKESFKLSLLCLAATLIVCLPWYLPLILKYGVSPHSKEMEWFMRNFTVLHQRKPLNFYIFTSGISIFFIPFVFLGLIFKRSAKNILFLLWIILGAVATYIGWRGYVAVVPIVSAISISIGLSWMVHSWFKQRSLSIAVFFMVMFLVVGSVGYFISSARIKPLDPKQYNEVRTNEKSTKMLKFLRDNYPGAATIDHVTWVSEDAALGRVRMIGGQYLEYLPSGSSEVFKDISRVYLSAEEEAYQLCRKHKVDLIIVRKQFLLLPQLSILFAPPEFDSQDYMKVTKESQESREITINFTPKGRQSMLFRMLNTEKLERFELVYADGYKNEPIPSLVVYRVRKDSLK